MRTLITQIIDEAGTDVLDAAGIPFEVWPGPDPIPRVTLLERIGGCSGLVSMPTDIIDGAVLDAGPVRVVAQHAVGVDNIDLDAARERGVIVTHTPGVLTEATADLAMALLLSLARRVVEGDELIRSGGFAGWRPTLLRGVDLHGATLGIVGLGRIGRAVSDRASAFGMRIIHHSRSGGVDFEELLQTSDVVSLHCPLTPETHHLIDEAALRTMKSNALLINTARGSVVDETALVHALENGWIGGAGLDVFEAEPAVHPGLIASPKTVLLPHLGSATHGTRRRMAAMVANNLVAALQGQSPPNPVFREGT